jgi:predicted transcriptional regulator
MVKQTSLLAFHSLNLQKRETQVLEVIKKARVGITNNEISRYLHLPINCITGRTNSLVKKGLVYNFKKRPDFYTKKLSFVWVSYEN